MQDVRSARERRPSRPLEGSPTAGTCVLHVDFWCLVYDADGREETSFEVSMEEVSFATKTLQHFGIALEMESADRFQPSVFSVLQ